MSQGEVLRAVQRALDALLAEMDRQENGAVLPASASDTPSPLEAEDIDPLPPVPDGWGQPSTDLAVVRQQYVDAAQRAAELATASAAVLADWRSLIVKPRAVESMFLAASLALGRVIDDIADNEKVTTPCDECKWVIADDTARLVLAYRDSLMTQNMAVTEFVQWAVRSLAGHVSAQDAEANRILHNLNAAEMIDLFDLPR